LPLAASETSTVVIRIGGPITRADVPLLCAQLRLLANGGGAERVVCDVASLLQPDAGTVDALARLQLAARRLGYRLRLRRASAELQELLAFMGLQDALRLEPGRQAEEREQGLGVEEERELGDSLA
jgi:ABC-type transporter Mla MlaB component